MYEELVSVLLAIVASYFIISDNRIERRRQAAQRLSSGRPFDRRGPPREVRRYTTRFGGLPGPLRSQESIDAEVNRNDLLGFGSRLS